MKRFLFVIVSILLFACSNDDCCKNNSSNNPINDMSLVGEWENEYLKFVFNDDNTGFRVDDEGYCRYFEWENVDNFMCIYFETENVKKDVVCTAFTINNEFLIFEAGKFAKVE